MYIDKKLGGIQAVQTLSRLKRARAGKDTTYVIDFVNDVKQVLDSFRTYYTTAEIEGTSDPNVILDIKAKLDGLGYYENANVDRLVAAVFNPQSKQGDLNSILVPIADRLIKAHKEATKRLKAAQSGVSEDRMQDMKNELEAIELFKKDMGTFQHLYTFFSQIIDYGSTEVEKRFIFYKYLLPLLEFGREREGVDISKIRLTHYKLKDEGSRDLPLQEGDKDLLKPITESGSGSVQEKEKELLEEIIE